MASGGRHEDSNSFFSLFDNEPGGTDDVPAPAFNVFSVPRF